MSVIEIVEDADTFKIVVDKNKYLLERPVDVGEAKATMAIVAKKDGENVTDVSKLSEESKVDFAGIVIKDISYPKDFFTYDSVKKTADNLETQMEAGSCKPCTIMKEVGNTKKTYMTPTLRDFLGLCLGCDIPENVDDK